MSSDGGVCLYFGLIESAPFWDVSAPFVFFVSACGSGGCVTLPAKTSARVTPTRAQLATNLPDGGVTYVKRTRVTGCLTPTHVIDAASSAIAVRGQGKNWRCGAFSPFFAAIFGAGRQRWRTQWVSFICVVAVVAREAAATTEVRLYFGHDFNGTEHNIRM